MICSLLKIRVLEYDASAFKDPEIQRHEEYEVLKITKHPRYKPRQHRPRPSTNVYWLR